MPAPGRTNGRQRRGRADRGDRPGTGIQWRLRFTLVVFLAAMASEFFIASVRLGWRWAHVLMGIIFLAAAIWAFVNPIGTFWALASVIGLLLILGGASS